MHKPLKDRAMHPYSQQNRQLFIYLMVMAAACAFGFQGWRAMLTNFAVENVGINGQQMGMIQGVREIPGFLAFGVIYVLMLIREYRLGALSVVIMGMGIALVGFMPSYGGLLVTTIIMSFGFHYYETVNQSLTLQHFSKEQVPLVMGRARAAFAMANIAAVIVVFGLNWVMGFKPAFMIMGGIAALVAVRFMFNDPVPKQAKPQKTRMIVRKRYWLFYALTFMGGARRQIFVAFALFLLVEKFQFSVQEITVLFLLNNLVNWLIAPKIGWAINRFGERAMLTFEYVGLFVIFLVYAFTDSKLIITLAYIADNILYGFYICIPSYFRKIADPAEVAPSMAVGFTINHIVAVLVPIFGGLVWLFDYRICFVAGSVFALISLSLAQLTSKNRIAQTAQE
jgi:predicted MFS family arabinose efflux permease